jgi:uncharacterized membrane protein YkvA (DUF1232 family)
MTDQRTRRTSDDARAGLLAELMRSVRLAWRLMRDPRVATMPKLLIPALVGAYILWPVDFLPDLIPLLGQLDDLAILALAIRLFIELSPPDVVRQYRAAEARSGIKQGQNSHEGETIDAEYRVVE